MNVLSLEDDDYEGLFITQSDPKNVGSQDFVSPCVSLVSQKSNAEPIYENISDAEDFQIPSSQMVNVDERYKFWLSV